MRLDEVTRRCEAIHRDSATVWGLGFGGSLNVYVYTSTLQHIAGPSPRISDGFMRFYGKVLLGSLGLLLEEDARKHTIGSRV